MGKTENLEKGVRAKADGQGGCGADDGEKAVCLLFRSGKLLLGSVSAFGQRFCFWECSFFRLLLLHRVFGMGLRGCGGLCLLFRSGNNRSFPSGGVFGCKKRASALPIPVLLFLLCVQCVMTSTPSSVMATVYSHCAESDPSSV